MDGKSRATITATLAGRPVPARFLVHLNRIGCHHGLWRGTSMGQESWSGSASCKTP